MWSRSCHDDARSLQCRSAHRGQTKRNVQLAIGEQPTVRGDPIPWNSSLIWRSKVTTKRRLLGFTRRIRHPGSLHRLYRSEISTRINTKDHQIAASSGKCGIRECREDARKRCWPNHGAPHSIHCGRSCHYHRQSLPGEEQHTRQHCVRSRALTPGAGSEGRGEGRERGDRRPPGSLVEEWRCPGEPGGVARSDSARSTRPRRL